MTGALSIGGASVKNRVFLAPMAGVTDTVFRSLCAEMGAGLVFTEMVSAKGIYYNNENTKALLRTSPFERPTAAQLFGSEPDIIAEAVKRITDEEDPPFDIIDINMGCPAPKIVNNGDGSALMKNPSLALAVVRAAVAASSAPVTVKLRKGFNSRWINAVEVAQAACEGGASAVAVHGRTRDQQYAGDADWEIIARVREAVPIPVIGNGDIKTPSDAKRMLEQTGCAAVMIGRAALGNPWIFRQTAMFLETGEIVPAPDLGERLSMFKRHLRALAAYKREETAVKEMRKHFCWYVKGINGASEARVRVNTAATLDDMLKIADDLRPFPQ
jgi:nifR3 family TIM-barrel protein